jgi:drug/metabolite transporter (DMT)-like permease
MSVHAAIVVTPSEWLIIVLAYLGTLVISGLITTVLNRRVRGRKRPIALGMIVFGLLIVATKEILESFRQIRVPDFIQMASLIGGFGLAAVGAFVYRFLARSGER